MSLYIFQAYNYGNFDDYPAKEEVLVAAHRGSHRDYPENSIAALSQSINDGIDIVELDIRRTKDSKLVVIHDSRIDRTTNGKGEVKNFSLAELKEFNLLFNEKETNEKIPGLEEFLQAAKGQIILNIDFKIDDIQAMLYSYELIEKHEMEEFIFFNVKDPRLIPILYQKNKNIKIMPVAFSSRKIRQALSHDYIDLIQLYYRPYSRRTLHNLNLKGVSVWVNSLGKYDRMQENGKEGFEELLKIKPVDFVQTDHPKELISFLKAKGLHK